MKKIFSLLSVALFCLAANAQKNLADVVKEAIDYAKANVAQKPELAIAPVVLTDGDTYVLDSQIDFGTQDAVIFGGGAKVIVKAGGQISTSGYLQVRCINFDCTEGTVAPIAMSATPDASLKGYDDTDASAVTYRYAGANQKVYFNDNTIKIFGCNFRELKTSLFYANKASWALDRLVIENCIAQLNVTSPDPLINLYGSSTGAIKHIVLQNNTIYNIDQTGTSAWMVRYGNASNAQPQKIWGTDATSDFVMYNNTISFPGKAFANNFPSKNNVTLDWKANVFYNTPYLQKTSSSAVRTFTAADNSIIMPEGKTIDATDGSKYGTADSSFVTIPTEALDFDNLPLYIKNFRPSEVSVAYAGQYGAERWNPVFKGEVTKAAEANYEYILGPDMLLFDGVNASGQTGKGYINPALRWIEYVNPTSTLTNNYAEAQNSNRWTSIDPATQVVGNWLQVTGANGKINSPVISKQWGKYIMLYVKNMSKVVVYGTGSASGSAADGNGLLLTATPLDGSNAVVAQSAAGSIYGKGTASASCAIELDPAKSYAIQINSLVEKDIQITGINLYGTDLHYNSEYFAPVEKTPGTNWETVMGPDMIKSVVAEADGKTYYIVSQNWIEYTNPTSTLAEGTEVQQSNRWTDINPATGVQGTWLQATGKNGSVLSPVLSSQWGKTITFKVQKSNGFTAYATGSSSSKATDLVYLKIVATPTDGSLPVVAASTPGTIYGKGTASDKASVVLDPSKKYSITVSSEYENGGNAKDIMLTGINLVCEDTSIAPAAEDGFDATGIQNVQTSSSKVALKKYVNAKGQIMIGNYNIAGQRVK